MTPFAINGFSTIYNPISSLRIFGSSVKTLLSSLSNDRVNCITSTLKRWLPDLLKLMMNLGQIFNFLDLKEINNFCNVKLAGQGCAISDFLLYFELCRCVNAFYNMCQWPS